MKPVNKEPYKRLAAGALLVCLLVSVVCSCTSRAGSEGGDANESPRVSSTPSSTTAGLANDSERSVAAFDGALDFTLVNFTRTDLYGIYVAPHDSSGWEENLIRNEQLLDGDIVKIRFNPQEKTAAWDLRVEDAEGNNAEWKNLNLREISLITLRMDKNVVTAEAE